MTNKTAGVLGAVTLMAGAGAAQAAPPVRADLDTVMNVTSYAELLQPIPDAVSLLKASDERSAATLLPLARDGDATTQEAQYYYHHHHFRGPFYHHHHHGFYRRFYHHHHHHHHHHFHRDYY